MARRTERQPLVVFDIGNVLLRFSPDRLRRNFDRSQPGVGEAVRRVVWETRTGLDFEKGRLSGRRFHAVLRRRAGLKVGYPAFRDSFNRIFTPIPQNLRLLKRVARRYPTALLSNTNPTHWPYLLKTYPALKAVRWPLASHLLKAMKPSAVVYRELCRRTGYAPGEVVYVDDHADFVRRARALGIRAVCYSGRMSLERLLSREGVRLSPGKGRGLVS